MRKSLFGLVAAFVLAIACNATAFAEDSGTYTGGDNNAPIEAEDKALKSGEYLIVTSLGKNQVLEVAGASKSDGANVQLQESNMGRHQSWKVNVSLNGEALIANSNAAKRLSVASGAKAGANVQVSKKANAKTQRWKVIANSDGTYSFASVANEKVALAVKGTKAASGANVMVSSFKKSNPAKAQRFRLVSTDPDGCAPGERVLDDGWYQLKCNANAGLVLDSSGLTTKTGANVMLCKLNNGLNQCFRLAYKNGYYTLKIGTGKYLTVQNGGLLELANVCQGESGKEAQWVIAKKGKGTYTLTNRKSSLVLDIAGSKASNGSNVLLRTKSSRKTQAFKIEPVKQLLANGTYSMVLAADDNKSIEVAGSSKKAGGSVKVNGAYAASNQRWVVKKVKGIEETYTIKNANSGLYLSMASNGSVRQSKLASNGSAYWQLSPSAAKFSLKNVKYGKFLSCASAKYGASVSGKAKLAGKYQRFTFEKRASLRNVTNDIVLDRRIKSLADNLGSLRSCYNWVMGHKHTNWATAGGVARYSNGTYGLSTAWAKEEAKRMIDGKPVDCYAFAACFAALAKAKGYDAKVVNGYVPSLSQGWASHSWTEIKMNGVTYVYDANLGRSYPYVNFYGFTYSNSPTRYMK